MHVIKSELLMESATMVFVLETPIILKIFSETFLLVYKHGENDTD